MSVPVCVERARSLRWIVPAMIATNLAAAVAVYVILHAMPRTPPLLQWLIPGLVGMATIPATLFLIASEQPATITMTRALVTVVPIRVCGIRFGAECHRSLSEFSGILIRKAGLPRGGISYRIVLQGKAGRRDVAFRAPVQAEAALYAHRLGAALGISVRGPA